MHSVHQIKTHLLQWTTEPQVIHIYHDMIDMIGKQNLNNQLHSPSLPWSQIILIISLPSPRKGTKHKDGWIVYHDALSLMTSKKSKDPVRDKVHMKWCSLPRNDLFNNSTDLKNTNTLRIHKKTLYIDFIPSEIPISIRISTRRPLCLWCYSSPHTLPDDHIHKLSGSALKCIALSYKIILSASPCPERIIEYCKRVL